MSDYINENLLSSEPLKKQRDEAKALVGKWERTGLLDGLDEEFKRSSMAQLLENQARQLISEVSRTSTNAGSMGTGYKGDEEWSGVALPLVRRVFGEIAAQDFVSVQPMNLPSGLVFYLDFKYGTAVAGRTTSESLGGATGPFSPSGSNAPFGNDSGLYGAGRYGYSVSGSDVTINLSAASTASLSDINFDEEISGSVASGHEIYVVSTSISGTSNPDKQALRSWRLKDHATSTTITSENKILNVFTKQDDQDMLKFVMTGSTATSESAAMILTYYKQPGEATRGDFEDTQGDATNDKLSIPEVNLQLKSRPIVAKTRKLKAVWTPELAQDLNAYHSVDAEAELTSMLSEYISMEIDLEILDMLISDATTVDYWSAKQGSDYDAGSTAFVNTTFYGTRFEWYQTLVQKIQKVSNEIHRLTLRGGANFVVCSPKVSTLLESLPGYNSSSVKDAPMYAMGVTKIGAVDGRFNVYKNPYMHENTVLVGFRGGSFLETGAVYAPYVPLIMTPLVYDPSDFTPRKGVMTRYAKKMIRPEFFGKIHVSDLNLV